MIKMEKNYIYVEFNDDNIVTKLEETNSIEKNKLIPCFNEVGFLNLKDVKNKDADLLPDDEFNQLIKRCNRFYSYDNGFIIETTLPINELKELTNQKQLEILYS